MILEKLRQKFQSKQKVIFEFSFNYAKSANCIVNFQNKVDKLNALSKELDSAYNSNKISRKLYREGIKKMKEEVQSIQKLLGYYEEALLKAIEKKANTENKLHY
ncbi:hypothetical protein [Dysgonomonas sp. 520]|uniref:hypothetical protein n=1 Tax=Dysgonomonas sp. 520 TaxID=2302931 RepID=UPI0013CFFAF2|nr:hypothetical protein [Dysgonomonas sp. 520]NDW11185.1 hypothetical protein [Dysgonomonas sp. 520]